MANDVRTRFKNAFNAFMNRNDDEYNYQATGSSSYYRPDRVRLTRGGERTIVTSIYNRIALDVAAINIRHVRVDANGRYSEEIKSGLNECLSVEANTDQTGRMLIQDIVMTCLDEGVACVVPENTTVNPEKTSSYDILSMRVGSIVEWFPKHVRVRLYNEETGLKEEITLSKANVAIIENPLYSVINEPNSTVQRLIRKLNLLDDIDEQSSSGKLDLIIQLPYTIKSEARRQQAEQRRKDIEDQLAGSRYGIAYADATEHITQLNRSVENNLLNTIQYLTKLMYSQIGITQNILEGTAGDQEYLNYKNQTIEPFISAICNEFKRKFISKTARTQGQSIKYFEEPFKLVPVAQIADIADKFTRNEILTPNEVRQIIGMKPADDQNADELRNRNISQSADEIKTKLGMTDENGMPIDDESGAPVDDGSGYYEDESGYQDDGYADQYTDESDGQVDTDMPVDNVPTGAAEAFDGAPDDSDDESTEDTRVDTDMPVDDVPTGAAEAFDEAPNDSDNESDSKPKTSKSKPGLDAFDADDLDEEQARAFLGV